MIRVQFEGLGQKWDREYELCSVPRVGEYVEFNADVYGRVSLVRYQPGCPFPVVHLKQIDRKAYDQILNPSVLNELI